MDILDVIKSRHSVRQYKDIPIEMEKRELLNNCLKELNLESGLDIKIIYDEPKAFQHILCKYGKFKNVKNYIVVFGNKNMAETVGYYGEKLVLKAQELGLNTCWAALTFDKGLVKKLDKNKKLYLVIALGYGETQGAERKSKPKEKVVEIDGDLPDKFWDGIEASLLAPTAVNQQKFKIICKDKKVSIVKSGIGFYSQVDLGIIKCHFELATGIKVFNND